MHRNRIIFFLALVVLALAFSYSLWFQDVLFSAVTTTERAIRGHESTGITLFIGLAALSAMLSPFSSVPLVPLAVAIWGELFTFLYLFTGWLIGGTVTYLIGRFGGYPLVRRFISIEKYDHYREKLMQYGRFWIVLLFRFAMPAEIPGYLLGITRCHFGKYFLATFLAELPFAIGAVYASGAFLENKIFVFVITIGVLLLGISAAFYFFRKHHVSSML